MSGSRSSGNAAAPKHGPETQATGTASSRRKRRRMLAESFASGERTFGAEEDPEMMQAFIERGLRTGGVSGRAAVAERENQVCWGSPWPLRRDEFLGRVLQGLVREGAANDVRVEITVGATPFLNLTGPRDGESNVVRMFWRCVVETAEIAGEDVIENLPIPPKWVEQVQQSPEGAQRVGSRLPSVTRVPSVEAGEGTFDSNERRARATAHSRDSRRGRAPHDP